MRAVAILSILVAVLACRRIDAGDVPDAPTDEAQRIFDADVYPILAAKCGSGDCHGDATFSRTPARFVDDDRRYGWLTASRFTSLTGPFIADHAPILRRIAAGHMGIAYTPDEVAAIERWLAQELSVRAVIAFDPVRVAMLAREELARFRGCMTLEAFDAANMAIWASLQAQDNTRCANCHASGAAGFIASGNVSAFYETLHDTEALFLQYLTVDVFGDSVTIGANFYTFDAISTGQDPHREHPRFDPFASAGMMALRSFEMLVEDRIARGECEPSPFP